MRELLKAWCVPGSMSCLGLMMTGTLPLIMLRRTRGIGTALFLAGTLLTGALAVPVISELIASRFTPAHEPTTATHVDAVVLLLGDSPRSRIGETVRVFRQWQPRWVIVSGPTEWAETLREYGVPPERLLVESRSHNTYEQAAMLEPLLVEHHIRRMFLVASRLHIPRAVGTFRSRGYDVIPVASPIDDQESLAGWRRWVPREAALTLSRDAIYEYAAWSYYWWEGWLSPTNVQPRASAFSIESWQLSRSIGSYAMTSRSLGSNRNASETCCSRESRFPAAQSAREYS
jgi:uncharacterized SAM-binding protein YcdF (DUF218 family)